MTTRRFLIAIGALALAGCRAPSPAATSAPVLYPDAQRSATDLDEYRYVARPGSATPAALGALWRCTLRELPAAGWRLDARDDARRTARLRSRSAPVELFVKVDTVAAIGRGAVHLRADRIQADSTRVRIRSAAPEWRLLTTTGGRLAPCTHAP